MSHADSGSQCSGGMCICQGEIQHILENADRLKGRNGCVNKLRGQKAAEYRDVSLSLKERLELYCSFTDLVPEINPTANHQGKAEQSGAELDQRAGLRD